MRALMIGVAIFLVGLAATMAAESAEAPTVSIDTPSGGWSTERIVQISGMVSDEAIKRAVLVVNGYERWIDVQAGKFSATLVVSRGANTLEVMARNQAGEGRDSVSLFSDVPAVDMQVVLSWDTDKTDVDLHVLDPKGEECYYAHRVTKAAGKLDLDDTDGHGPEVFTLTHAPTGSYQVSVKYFSSHGHPQTRCRVQVVLFEGTNRERRLEFFKILTKTGDKVEVGRFDLAGPSRIEDTGEVKP